MPPEAEAEAAHRRALESLYRRAPVNGLFESRIEIAEPGFARIRFEVRDELFHAAGAAHGTLYFKMMDDAAFYACNSLVSDRFLLTTAFNLLFTKPLRAGPATAEGRWVSGRRRVLIGEARLLDSEGELAASGTGTFMRSHIPLSGLPGYEA
ncbi:MAG: PaaI family thioesterase [Allosphingosinicella sp.]